MSDQPTKSIHDWKKAELLKLPVNRDPSAKYSSLMLVPDRTKHESGWSYIALIGLVNEVPTCIAGHCDDLSVFDQYDVRHGRSMQPNTIRLDATYPSGVLHLWVRDHDMSVDGYSSTTVKYFKRSDA